MVSLAVYKHVASQVDCCHLSPSKSPLPVPRDVQRPLDTCPTKVWPLVTLIVDRQKGSCQCPERDIRTVYRHTTSANAAILPVYLRWVLRLKLIFFSTLGGAYRPHAIPSEKPSKLDCGALW